MIGNALTWQQNNPTADVGQKENGGVSPAVSLSF
jgi:hypothetical protein